MARLILMTQPEFVEPATDVLRRAAPSASLAFAWTLEDLKATLSDTTEATRILSIGSSVIVPREILEHLTSPAYNLHPGPPSYPGIFPSVFALDDDAPTFGVTLHEMAPVVDSGAIVAVERFKIDPRWDRLALDMHTFVVLMHLLERTALPLAQTDVPLPHLDEAWTGPRRTRKDFDALCRLPTDFTPEDLAKRLRAVGEGPDHALTVTRGGEVFRVETGRRGQILRGGQPVSTPS